MKLGRLGKIAGVAAVMTEAPTPVMMAPCRRLMKVPIMSPIPAAVQTTSARKPTACKTSMVVPVDRTGLGPVTP